MAEWIAAGEVSVDDLTGRFNFNAFTGDQIEAIKMGDSLGCGLIMSSRESITLVPHGEIPGQVSKRLHISARKQVPLHRMVKQIKRMGDPKIIEHLDTIAKKVSSASDVIAAVEAIDEWDQSISTLEARKSNRAEIMLPDYEQPKERHVKEVPSPSEVAAKVKKERHVVSERPALMHRGITNKGGQSYPSRTTMERRWSDGDIEYICAVEGCDSEPSKNRLSFRGAHYGMHVRKGEAPALNGDERKELVDDPTYTEPAYTKEGNGSRRLDGLVNVLKGIDLTQMSPEDVAEQIEAYLQSLYGNGGGGGQSEPLTPEQIIDRIRAMVDTGKYADQEKALIAAKQEVADLAAYAEQREAELDSQRLQAEQRAIGAETHLAALRDLINESVGGQA